jgi:hypothetical protein
MARITEGADLAHRGVHEGTVELRSRVERARAPCALRVIRVIRQLQLSVALSAMVPEMPL